MVRPKPIQEGESIPWQMLLYPLARRHQFLLALFSCEFQDAFIRITKQEAVDFVLQLWWKEALTLHPRHRVFGQKVGNRPIFFQKPNDFQIIDRSTYLPFLENFALEGDPIIVTIA